MNTITSDSSTTILSTLVSDISSDIVSQNDTDADSALTIDESGLDDDIFASLDSDEDGLLTQSEIASAIDSKLSEYDEMPSSDEFASLLSELGLQMPTTSDVTASSSQDSSEFAAELISSYDTDGDSTLTSDEVSILTDEEFSALDADGDGSITADELTSAIDSLSSNMTAGISETTDTTETEEEDSTSADTATTVASTGATTASSGTASTSGSSSSSEEDEDEEYDIMDTNEDGVVSKAEIDAYYGIDDDDTQTADSDTATDDSLDNIKMLFEAIKGNSQDSEDDLDLSNFSSIMKMVNNGNSTGEYNTYVNNLSDRSSSLYGYA